MTKNNFKILYIKELKELDLKNLHIESINYDSGLTINLNSTDFLIAIKFNRFISYRVSYESHLLEYWEILDDHNINGYTFYKIENSSYLKEMQSLSKDFFVAGMDMIEHYAIFTYSECVEIISDLSPHIELINKV